MTEHEKRLLEEHALALKVACNVLYRNWLDVSRIQLDLGKLLTASEVGDDGKAEPTP